MENNFLEFSTRFSTKIDELSSYVDQVSVKTNKDKFRDGIQFIEKIDKIRLKFQSIEHHDLINGDEGELIKFLTKIIEQTLSLKVELEEDEKTKKELNKTENDLITKVS